MLLDFDEHMFHRRIMQEAFVRTRLVGYTEQVDTVVSKVIANDWVANDPRFLLYPAMKQMTLDIASMVFMGHELGTDHELVTKVNNAFTTTVRAGNAIIRTGLPPFTWWRGLQARKLLENYFQARVKEQLLHPRLEVVLQQLAGLQAAPPGERRHPGADDRVTGADGGGEGVVDLGDQLVVAARLVAHEHHRGDVERHLLHRGIEQEPGSLATQSLATTWDTTLSTCSV